MKKLLFSLLAILLAVVGTLLGYDRSSIKGTADRGLQNSIDNGAALGVVQNDLEHVKADVDDLKIGQRMIREGQQTLLDTLYQLPSERRNSTKPVLEAIE